MKSQPDHNPLQATQDLIDSIHKIDLMLKQANCTLMFTQPRKPGKITLKFYEESDASIFGIPRVPRPIQWHRRVNTNSWYYITLPPTYLTKRAKGKEEFGTGYHHTVATLKIIGELLEHRKRAVGILHQLSVKLAFFNNATKDWFKPAEDDLAAAYIGHSHLRHAREPNLAEWQWFASGGASDFPGASDEASPEFVGRGNGEDTDGEDD